MTDAVLLQLRKTNAPKDAPVAITFPNPGRASVGRAKWISIDIGVHPTRENGDSGPWRTHTISYTFALFGGPKDEAREQLCYHLHPASDVKVPHLHLAARADWVAGGLRKKHLPTGRVTVEDFVELLIVEFGVNPKRRDWEDVLAANRAVFEDRRTW